MALYNNNIAATQDSGGLMVQVPDETVVDNVRVFNGPSGSKWERVIEGRTFKASYIVNGTNDATSALTAILAFGGIEVLIIDLPVTISGTLTVPTGKIIEFEEGGYLTGIATVNGGGMFKSDVWTKIFDANITATTLLPYTNVVTPQNFGAVANNTSDDGPNCTRLMAYIGTLSHKFPVILFPAAQYLINTTIIMPGGLSGTTLTPCLTMSGYGVELKTTSDICIFLRMPTNTTEQSAFINGYQMTIEGFTISGNSIFASPKVNQFAFRLGATYMWELKDMHFIQLYQGVIMEFALNAHLSNLHFTNCSYNPIYGRSGTWTGATTTNSSFNACVIERCRFFGADGSFASVWLYAADQTVVRNCISEGKNPQYNFYYDYGGSTGVNINRFEDIWIESTSGATYSQNTNFYIRGKGTLILDKIQRIYPNRFFEISDTSAAVTLVIGVIPYAGNIPVSGLTFFKAGASASGGSVSFLGAAIAQTTGASYISDPINWDSGILPSFLAIDAISGFSSTSGFYGMYLGSTGQYTLQGHFMQTADNTFALGANRSDLNPATTLKRPKYLAVGTSGIGMDAGAKFRFVKTAGSPTSGDLAFSQPAVGVFRIEGLGFDLPVVTTGTRPTTNVGRLEYNSSLGVPEFWNGAAWIPWGTATASFALPITTVASNFTLDNTMRTVLVDSTSGNISVTIDPTALDTREFVIIKKSSDPNVITLNLTSGTIGGDTTRTLVLQYEKIRFQVEPGSPVSNLWDT